MRRPGIVILIWLGCVLASMGVVVFRTTLTSDASQFLPNHSAGAELLSDLYASAAGRIVLIGLEGGTPDARAQASRRLADSLRANGLFVRVANGAEQPGPDEQQALFARRYLFSDRLDPRTFTAEGLRAALQERLRELQSPASALGKKMLSQDPTGELLPLLRRWLGGYRQPRMRLGVWFSPGGERALLLAETRASGLDTEAQAAAAQAIDAAFAEAAPEGGLTLLSTGPGVIASLTARTIRHEAEWLSAGASVLVLLLLTAAYRSPRIVLLNLLAPLSAIPVAIAAVQLSFGSIHAITLGFGCTLLGLSVDYPIHLLSRMNRTEAAMVTLRRIWPMLLLCAATTMIGYLPMVSRSFPSLTQLALFSVVGLATTLAFTRCILPHLLPATWRPPEASSLWRAAFLDDPSLIGRAAVCLCVLVPAVVSLVVVAPARWQNDIAALSPVPPAILARDAALRSDLQAPEPGQMIVIRAPDAETALASSERVAARLAQAVQAGSLAGFDAPSLALPSVAMQRSRQALLPEQSVLEAALAEAQQGLPFRPGLFTPFVEAIARSRSADPVTYDDIIQTSLGPRLGTLLFPRDDGWTAILPLAAVHDPAGIASLVAGLGDPGVRFVDLRGETNRLIGEFRNEVMAGLAVGACLLFAVLCASLRSWRRTLVVLVPVAVALVADLAIVSLLGQRLSLFHIIAVLLVAGTTVDYALFFNRCDLDTADRQRNLRALLLCWSASLSGFGLLALSSVPVLQAIGTTLVAGLTVGLLVAAVVPQPGLRRWRRGLTSHRIQ